MSNILVSLKRFITNKNTITVLGVIVILILLYYGYNKSIKDQTDPVYVPVATQTIQPRTKITDDMVTSIEVPRKFLSSIEDNKAVTVTRDIVGKYSAINSVIPMGSIFYADVLITEEQIPDNPFYQVPEGQRPYAMSVTTANTYGNSIFPGNVIDVYMKAVDENGQVMVGRFLEKVEVLAVKDNVGNNVFEDTTANRTPATLLFGVPEDVYILLKKAEYLKSYGVEVFPVPYGGKAPEGALTVGRQELVDYINSNTVNFYEETDTPIEEDQTDEQ